MSAAKNTQIARILGVEIGFIQGEYYGLAVTLELPNNSLAMFYCPFPNDLAASWAIRGVLSVVGVNTTKELIHAACRVEFERYCPAKIGHYFDNRWFNPDLFPFV